MFKRRGKMSKPEVNQIMMDFVNDFMARIVKKDVWDRDEIHMEICSVMFDSVVKYLGQEEYNGSRQNKD